MLGLKKKISAWRSKRSLKRAIKRANRYAVQTGRRFYVVSIANKKLAVVDNTFIHTYNKVAKVKIKANDLKKRALYCTPWDTKAKKN